MTTNTTRKLTPEEVQKLNKEFDMDLDDLFGLKKFEKVVAEKGVNDALIEFFGPKSKN